MGIRWRDGYSAFTDARLEVGDRTFPVAQVAGSVLMLRKSNDEPLGIPPGTAAVLVVIVDDWEKRYEIILPHGIAEDVGNPIVFF